MQKVSNRQEFIDYINSNVDFDYLKNITKKCIDNGGKLVLKGYCDSCGRESEFLYDISCSDIDLNANINDETLLNFRERGVCKSCRLNTRMRFMASNLLKSTVDGLCPGNYIHEASSPFFRYLKMKNPKTVGSEYFGKSYGPKFRGILNEDCCNLSFKDNTFNNIISNDVFEHVYDIDAALREAFRVMRNNGKLFLSVPFCYQRDKTVQRAVLKNDKIDYLLEPAYHGSTRKGESKTLVFYDFGWDLLEKINNAGFKHTEILMSFDKNKMYLHPDLSIIIATKEDPQSIKDNEYEPDPEHILQIFLNKLRYLKYKFMW